MKHVKIKIENRKDVAGFITTNVKKGEKADILTKSVLISDQPEFYEYTKQIANLFLAEVGIPIDAVSQFLIIIHNDLTVDIYK